MKTTELITVPTFTFNQGEFGETDWEKPIQVSFYNGQIELSQDGEYDDPERITLHPDHFMQLFKEIKKHFPEALEMLNRK